MIQILTVMQCFQYNYTENNPAKIKPAMIVLLTKTGLTKYCEKNSKIAIDYIFSNLQIPVLNFTMANFEVNLLQGKFLELEIKGIQIQFGENEATINIQNMSMNINFELTINQKQFPYLSDKGSLSIQIEQLTLETQIQLEFDTNCTNKYSIVVKHSKTTVKKFNFNFQCGMQIILNSIMSFITSVITNQLNGDLGIQLAGVVIKQLIKFQTSQMEVARIDLSERTATDQRYFKGLVIKQNFLIVQSSGQRCEYNNAEKTCYGWLETALESPPVYYSNNDVQYQIEKSAFNSGFKLYLEKGREVDGIHIQNITLTQFHNTGAQVNVEIQFEGVNVILEFLEPVIFKPVLVSPGMYFATFDIQLTRLISSSNILSQVQLESLSQYFRESYRTYQISYGNALGVSEKKAVTTYIDQNWIMIMSDIE